MGIILDDILECIRKQQSLKGDDSYYGNNSNVKILGENVLNLL